VCVALVQNTGLWDSMASSIAIETPLLIFDRRIVAEKIQAALADGDHCGTRQQGAELIALVGPETAGMMRMNSGRRAQLLRMDADQVYRRASTCEIASCHDHVLDARGRSAR